MRSPLGLSELEKVSNKIVIDCPPEARISKIKQRSEIIIGHCVNAVRLGSKSYERGANHTEALARLLQDLPGNADIIATIAHV